MQKLKPIFRPIYAPPLRLYRRRAARRAEQRRIRAQVRQVQQAGDAVKLIIGAGQTRYAGWIPTDMPAFDVIKAEHWRQLFPPQSIDRLLAEHVFEHLTTAQFSDFLRLARRYLKPTGRIRIAVPDGFHPAADYIERVRPGGIGESAQDHKTLYTCALIGDLLRAGGYHYQLLEYFDAAGAFQWQPWDAADGFINRSAEHDRRNADGNLNYTSLIVDCWL